MQLYIQSYQGCHFVELIDAEKYTCAPVKHHLKRLDLQAFMGQMQSSSVEDAPKIEGTVKMPLQEQDKSG